MANVLSVLEKAMDDDIRNQVAIFEIVTVKNIMETEGGRKGCWDGELCGEALGSKESPGEGFEAQQHRGTD